MKTGIVGVNGFIGRSVVEQIDLTSSDIVGFMRKAHLKIGRDCVIRTLDIFNSSADDFNDLDAIVLCASATNPRTKSNSFLNELHANVLPHIHLIEQLKNTKVKHLVYLSSGGTVYGNVEKDIIDESFPTNPLCPYGYGKVCIEEAIEEMWSGEGRKYTIIRPSNPVGKYQIQSLGAHGLVTTVYTKIKNSELIEIFGDGNTVRDFFLVSDLTKLIQKVLKSNHRNNCIINASSGIGHSINEIVETCADFFNVTPDLVYHRERKPLIKKNVLCNQLACEKFNWKPIQHIYEIIEALDYEVKQGKILWREKKP